MRGYHRALGPRTENDCEERCQKDVTVVVFQINVSKETEGDFLRSGGIKSWCLVKVFVVLKFVLIMTVLTPSST